MVAMTSCILAGHIISIDDAIDIKNSAQPATFLCCECNRPVTPYKKRTVIGTPAHFQHTARNPDCSLSHQKP